jgi:hypothetical protein
VPSNSIPSPLVLQSAFDTAWGMLQATRGSPASDYIQNIATALRERIAEAAAIGETDPQRLAKAALANLFLSPNF